MLRRWWADKKATLILLGVAGVALLAFASFSSLGDPVTPVHTGTADVGSGSVTVRYEVEGTASTADLTMQTPTGMQQDQDIDVPSFAGVEYGFQRGDFVSLLVQNGGDGEITCRITVAGEVLSENTATGEYAIASCDGEA